MLFRAIPNSQTAQETSAGRTPGVLHAALWPVLRHKPEPEQNLDLNLTVHKMGPMEGVASGTEAEVMGLLCSSETLALCGAGGDHARLSPSLIWTRLSQVGPGGHTTITSLQVCSLCKAQQEGCSQTHLWPLRDCSCGVG